MDSIYMLGKKKYYVTKIVKNADLGRNLYDSTASLVGQICDDVCMKHDIPSRVETDCASNFVVFCGEERR